MDSISLRKYLDNLETNYCDIIVDTREKTEEEQFTRQTSLIKT